MSFGSNVGFNALNNFGKGVNNFAVPANTMAQTIQGGAGAGANLAQGAGNATKAGGMMNNITSGIGAGLGLAQFGVDIYNTIKQQQQAEKQLDMAKKNFNLELAKQQKQELAHNKLAASVDKAWGGEGKIEKTIDYSQFSPDGNSQLQQGGAGGEYIKDPYADSRNQTTQDSYAKLSESNANTLDSNAGLNGSGNAPLMASSGMQPVGYSASLSQNTQNPQEQEQNADSNGVME